MNTKLLRIGSLALGALLIADVAMPTRLETSKVRSHSISSSSSSDRHNLSWSSYQLEMENEKIGTCEVREETYRRLKDGDEVKVKVSGLMGSCLYVAWNEGLDTEPDSRFAFGLAGLICLLFGFGLIPVGFFKSEDN